MISKVRIEESAVKVMPNNFLHVFGSTDEKCMFYANRRSIKVVSPAAKCNTLDKFENCTGKKASLINLSLTLRNSTIHIAVFIIQEQTSIFNKTGSHANP